MIVMHKFMNPNMGILEDVLIIWAIALVARGMFCGIA